MPVQALKYDPYNMTIGNLSEQEYGSPRTN